MLFSTTQFVEICYSNSRKLTLWLNHLLVIDQFKFSILGEISFNRLWLPRICIFHPSHLICWHTIFHGVHLCSFFFFCKVDSNFYSLILDFSNLNVPIFSLVSLAKVLSVLLFSKKQLLFLSVFYVFLCTI